MATRLIKQKPRKSVDWCSKCIVYVVIVQHVQHVPTSVNIELNVNVLTMGYWPTYTPMDVNLPEDVGSACPHLCVHVGAKICHPILS